MGSSVASFKPITINELPTRTENRPWNGVGSLCVLGSEPKFMGRADDERKPLIHNA